MPARFRRRNKLPLPRFQLRLIGGFVMLGVLCLCLQFTLIVSRLLDLANRLPSDGALVTDSLPGLVLTVLGVSLVLILPATLLVGVFLTFRWAGPLFRFHKHLREVAAGQDPGPCRLRDGDELQELCELINRALDAARAQGAAQGSAQPVERPPAEAA